jgi:hypothetical protein
MSAFSNIVCLGDEAGGIDRVLDLDRADPVARRLDPADEIQKAVLVGVDRVAGEDRQLGQTPKPRSAAAKPSCSAARPA